MIGFPLKKNHGAKQSQVSLLMGSRRKSSPTSGARFFFRMIFWTSLISFWICRSFPPDCLPLQRMVGARGSPVILLFFLIAWVRNWYMLRHVWSKFLASNGKPFSVGCAILVWAQMTQKQLGQPLYLYIFIYICYSMCIYVYIHVNICANQTCIYGVHTDI